jgi:methylenetetrahydrofolate dehydrogenase (NADP+)/methenyltetrahydrofolate cyclohydrolase
MAMRMLQAIGGDPSGMNAVVVGDRNIVGRPMALELILAGATTTVCHSRTRDLAPTGRADLLVAAVGQAAMVRGD